MARAKTLNNPVRPRDKTASVITVSPKTDEVLLKYTHDEHKDDGWAPRPIHRIPPELFVSIGPELYEATERIKNAYKFRKIIRDRTGNNSFCGTPMPLYVTYGAGYNADQLDDWWRFSITVQGWHIIAAGDDSVVVIHHYNGELTIIEGDASKFDHTVRLSALLAEWRFLRKYGVSQYTIDLMRANARAPCIVRPVEKDVTQIQWTVYRDHERNTGGADTTVGNTILMNMGWVAVLYDLEDDVPTSKITEGFTKLGFNMKVKTQRGHMHDFGEKLWPPSFLKGTWWMLGPVSEQQEYAFRWGPLLSRVLKITKTMSDPRKTYKCADLKEALERHMTGVAQAMAPYTWPEPLKVWLWENWGKSPQRTPVFEEFEAHKPKASVHGPGLPKLWVEQACNWYCAYPEEIREWCSLWTSSRVGDFVCHPLNIRMALRDYN